MFCINCGNKIKSNEKFCTKCGQSVDNINEAKNVSIGITENTNLFKSFLQLMWDKKALIKNWLIKIILFLCVYFLSLTIINALSNSYYDDNTFTALAPTILIIFLWGKIAKRFNL